VIYQDDTIVIGAVAYDPKIVTIWDGFQAWLGQRGLKFDYVLYSNYERQVAGHLAGHFHAAWNSPLAWLQTERAAKAAGREARAVVMRDTDRDLTSVVVTKADGPIGAIEDLRGKRVAVGAKDSPQATLIPLHALAEAGLVAGEDFELVPFEVGVGKHGDHIGGERDAVKALLAGDADAACMIDGNHLAFTREGTVPTGATRILLQTGPYDHCNFTVLDDAPAALIGRFRELLLSMSYGDPEVRPLLDLEGLKVWTDGRTSGYGLLEGAIDRFGTIDDFIASMGKRCM